MNELDVLMNEMMSKPWLWTMVMKMLVSLYKFRYFQNHNNVHHFYSVS